MYERIKTIIKRYPYSLPVIVAIVCLALIWGISNWRSNVDTTGIQDAEKQLERAREYNQQSINYNQRIRNEVESSQAINERIESAVTRSIETNQRTETAIDRSTELAQRAREDAERAKDIISQSRSILRTAEERNQKSENATAE